MSTETDLMRAIRDNPEEDTPRLMFADHLEENGFGARAEFIRVQIERARLPETDPARRAVEDREHELLAEHEYDWLGVAPEDTDELAGWQFDRGFIASVSASPVFMRTGGMGLCATHPVRRWFVTSGDRGNNFPEDLKEAGQRGWATRLEVIDLTNWYPDLGQIGGFLGRNSCFERLRELDLRKRGPLGSLSEIIEFAPFRDQLKSLRFGETGYDGRLEVAEFVAALGTVCRLDELAAPGAMLSTDDVRAILASDALAALTKLNLSGNQIEAGGWNAFRNTRFRLRELDLSNTELGAGALDRLLGCASLSELRRLHLRNCGGSAANIQALAKSRFWTQAEELRMPNGGMMQNYDVDMDYEDGEMPEEMAPAAPAAPASLDPLFAAEGSKCLRVLDLAGNNLRDAGVARLCAAPWAESLEYLDLSNNFLSDEALREIARCGRFKNLCELHLNFNSQYHQNDADEAITDAGLRALANCQVLPNLRRLYVSGTRLTITGVDAVLNSRYWQLTHLSLSRCQLQRNVVSAFVNSPRTARLELLDLSWNDDIGAGNLKPLADSEYLSPRTELHISGIGGEATKVRQTLRSRLGRRLHQ